MAIEKSAPLASTVLQPKLTPKSLASRGFKETLAATLGEEPAVAALPPAVAKQAVPRLAVNEVRGTVLGEVRGAVIRPEEQPVQQASGQFTPEEETLLAACARTVKRTARPAHPAKAPALDDPPSEVAAAAAADPEALSKIATAQVGRRYVPGGESPRQGFDCSGLASYVYSKNGLDIPRSSREQYKQGAPVSKEELRNGDLVFFGRKGVNHVGIYLNDGNFVHATTSGGSVKINSLNDPIWSKLYVGAKRVF